MGLFSSIGKIVGGVVKGAVGLATAPLKMAAGVANSIFGGDQQQGPCGPGPQGPSIFGPPPHMHGPHPHNHRPGMFPPPPGQGGVHIHFGG